MYLTELLSPGIVSRIQVENEVMPHGATDVFREVPLLYRHYRLRAFAYRAYQMVVVDRRQSLGKLVLILHRVMNDYAV